MVELTEYKTVTLQYDETKNPFQTVFLTFKTHPVAW